MKASDIEAFLDGIVPSQLHTEDIAGAVVVIVKNGSVLFAKGYGYADVKSRTPVSPESTLFRPGSISKTFTWTAVMQLVEQGKVNLDADVNDYLDFKIPHTFGRAVTMRNLMTHTAGFEEVVKDLAVAKPDELPSLRAFVIAHRPNQIFVPGTVPAYSNYGADLAGYIVQRVSGLPYQKYVETNIFQPLGMTNATFVEPLPERLKSMMSQGYALASQDAKPFELVPPEPAPDGGLSVTGADMARFMIAHLQNGKFGNARILQPQTAEMMHARQFSMDPTVNGMALGFYEENQNGLRIIGHGGDLQYFHSDMHLIPSEALGFFVSYNSLGKAELDVRTVLWRAFLDRYFPFVEPPAKAVADTGAAVTGEYLPSRRAQTTILRSLWWLLVENSVSQSSDGTIQVDQMKDPSGNPKHWRGIGNMTFREVGGQQLLVFKPDASGRMQMIGDDPTEIYQRVPWYLNKSFVQIALGLALLLFALTLILWPVGALLRRHYNRRLTLNAEERRLRLVVKIVCAIDLAAIVAFAAIVATGFSDLMVFSDGLDPWLRLLQVVFFLGLIGSAVILYNGYRACRTATAGLWTKIYALGLILASFIYAWFVIAGRLLQTSLKY
ncbi:MAG TPA: serine hydrolase domain-containing protein [Terriglobales bacterium]|nr:serine hydrolase domain-containing protein [Terriglobales bacterium]